MREKASYLNLDTCWHKSKSVSRAVKLLKNVIVIKKLVAINCDFNCIAKNSKLWAEKLKIMQVICMVGGVSMGGNL